MALSTADLPDLDSPDAVEQLGTDLATQGGKVADIAGGVKSTWQGLTSSYDAPEDTMVHSAMDKPDTTADDLKADSETVKSALHTYAEKIREFERRKTELKGKIETANQKWADANALEEPRQEWRTNYYVEDDPAGKRDAQKEAGDYELAVQGEMAQLQEDVFRAQIDCANAIGAVYGGERWELGGHGDGKGERLYGADAEMIEAAVASGQLGWSIPEAYTNESYAQYRILPGAGDSLKGTWDSTMHLFGWSGDQGKIDATRQGLKDFGKLLWDAGYLDQRGNDARGQLWQSLIVDQWNVAVNDNGYFIGGAAPDVLIGLATGGWGGAGVRGGKAILGQAGSKVKNGAIKYGDKAVQKLGDVPIPSLKLQPALSPAGGAAALGPMSGLVVNKVPLKDALGSMMKSETKSPEAATSTMPRTQGGAPSGSPSTQSWPSKGGKPLAVTTGDASVPNSTVTSRTPENVATFHNDENSHVSRVKATLTHDYGGSSRTEAAITAMIRALGFKTDEAGHLIAHRFLPKAGAHNYIPQDMNLNRSAWKTMENEWGDWTKQGYEVRAELFIDRSNPRPDKIGVRYKVIDPNAGPEAEPVYRNRVDFVNQSGEKFDRIPNDTIKEMAGKR